MSCNGCRVLRKGCSENCMLRQCLQSIQTPQAQGYATLFVAKFFGRAGLLSFVSAVPQHQRPALFQSLLYEAVGRTINPVGGAVGLLWTGKWHLCQSAIETVLHGGALHPLPDFTTNSPNLDNTSESEVDYLANSLKRKRSEDDDSNHVRGDLDLSLMSPAPERRADTLSDGSETTTSSRSGSSWDGRVEPEGRQREAKLLRLFF